MSSGYRYFKNGNKISVKPISYNIGTLATVLVFKKYDSALRNIISKPGYSNDEYFDTYMGDIFK
jgi:hypothetical protein